MTNDTTDKKYKSGTDASGDIRDQELLWPARQHPGDLILPRVHPTRFPGTWVAIYEDSIPADQRNALRVEGFKLYRIRILENNRAQVVIREDPRPDRDGNNKTDARYKNYNARTPRAYLDTETNQ